MVPSKIADNLEPIILILKEYATFFFSNYTQTSSSTLKVLYLSVPQVVGESDCLPPGVRKQSLKRLLPSTTLL